MSDKKSATSKLVEKVVAKVSPPKVDAQPGVVFTPTPAPKVETPKAQEPKHALELVAVVAATLAEPGRADWEATATKRAKALIAYIQSHQ